MLDKKYAADVVGEGDNGIVGPFEAAGRFIGGQVVPLVVGAFGEVNKDFEKVLKTLAKLAAAGEDGMSISPLRNLDRKGGAYVIMLQQFRPSFGSYRSERNGQTQTISFALLRKRYCAEEAKYTAEANHNNNRWKAGQRGSSWLTSTVGYTVYLIYVH